MGRVFAPERGGFIRDDEEYGLTLTRLDAFWLSSCRLSASIAEVDLTVLLAVLISVPLARGLDKDCSTEGVADLSGEDFGGGMLSWGLC